MRHNYKHILKAQMLAWAIQLALHACWNFSSKKKKSIGSLLREKNEDWWSQQGASQNSPKNLARVHVWELSLPGYFWEETRKHAQNFGMLREKSCWALTRCFTSINWFPHQNTSMKLVFIIILQMKKLRVQGVKKVGQCEEREWTSWDVIPDSSIS